MPRFLTEADYFNIKPEIKVAVTGTTDLNAPSAKQIAAENTAIAMLKKYLGGRYDMALLFSNTGDARDAWIVQCIVTITLYLLYHQTGMKDIPEHRKEDYNDVITWLTNVGSGEIPSDLPGLYDADGVFTGDVRIISRLPNNHKW